MAKLQVYSASGAKSGSFELPKELITKPNMNLLAQAMHVYEDRSHKGTSKVKTRGEVTASGAKIYKQKGTGRARHGDIKAPIFAGGGIAHGPKGVKRVLTLSKGIKDLAMKMAFAVKVKDEAVVVANGLASLKKTKEAQGFINKIVKEQGLKKNKNIIVALAEGKKESSLYFRNIEGVEVYPWNEINAYRMLLSKLMIVDKDAFNQIHKSPANKENNTKTTSLNLDTKLSPAPKKKQNPPKTAKPTKKKVQTKKAVKTLKKKAKK